MYTSDQEQQCYILIIKVVFRVFRSPFFVSFFGRALARHQGPLSKFSLVRSKREHLV
jgi:hypothetical protein